MELLHIKRCLLAYLILLTLLLNADSTFSSWSISGRCVLCVRASWHNLCWCIMPRWEPKKLPARRCLNLCWTLVAQFGYLCKAEQLCKGAHPENPQVRGFAEEEPTLLLARVWTNSMRGVQAWYWRPSHCLPGRENPYTFRRRTTGTFSFKLSCYLRLTLVW